MNFIDAVVNVDSDDSLGTPKVFCRGPGIGPNPTGILSILVSYVGFLFGMTLHTASTSMVSLPMSIFAVPA